MREKVIVVSNGSAFPLSENNLKYRLMCVTGRWAVAGKPFGTEVLNSTHYLISSQGQFYFVEIRDGSLTIVMNKEIHLCCCRSLLFEVLVFFTHIFGRLDSKIKGGVTYTMSVNMKMLFLCCRVYLLFNHTCTELVKNAFKQNCPSTSITATFSCLVYSKYTDISFLIRGTRYWDFTLEMKCWHTGWVDL